jgi:phosphatidylserine decarboxylase
MWDYINASIQGIFPQHFLSQCMYHATRWRWPPWKKFIIRLIIRRYQVDMTIAEQPDPEAYGNFNEFFTRILKSSARPIDNTPLSIVSPVDGSVSQIGDIKVDAILQAKGKHFSLPALLANDEDAVRRFKNGSFSTLYLSPRDYHRIHMAVDASLVKMIYVPGDLFSVNEATTRAVDQLFARNERLICLFETEFGLMATILVGAIFVGSMETVWQGEITPAKTRELCIWNYDSNSVQQTNYVKGEEIARFNMGSTVILLFEQNRISWSELIHVGDAVQMGQLLARGTA